MKIIIIIKDDLVRASIAYILQSFNMDPTIFEENDLCDTPFKNNPNEKFDLLIFDSSQIEYVNTIKTIRRLKNNFKQVPIVGLFDALDKIDIQQYFKLGINGCVEKTDCKDYLKMLITGGLDKSYYIPEHVMNSHAITKTRTQKNNKVKSKSKPHNELRLTTRQEEIMDFVKYGKSNKEIGDLLGLSEGTIRTHVAHIFDRLNVSNRTEAVHVATKLGFLANEN